MSVQTKPLLTVLNGQKAEKTPIWLMRQAGRYLPEYRALRAEKGGFLDLVQDPEAAADVTLQPIRRFGFDGAILFSDILMVPLDRKSTRLNSSHLVISYAVFCLKKKKNNKKEDGVLDINED